MARPPILPVAYPSTGLRIRFEDHFEIFDLLEATGADLKSINLIGVEHELNEAAVKFWNAREVGQPQSDFHAEIVAFSNALDRFLPAIPDANSALSSALTQHWKHLRHDHTSQSGAPFGGIDFTGQWAFAFPEPASLQALHEGLSSLRYAIQALKESEAVGGRTGKPAYREDHALVRSMANVFQSTTGRHPTRVVASNLTNSSDHRSRAGGSFGAFVKAVEGAMHASLLHALTTQKVKGIGKEARPYELSEAEAYAAGFRLRGIDSLIAALVKDSPPKIAD